MDFARRASGPLPIRRIRQPANNRSPQKHFLHVKLEVSEGSRGGGSEMRSIISAAKAVWPYLLSVVYGVFDRQFGDRVFDWIKPSIPQGLSPETLRLLATYVPPLLFIALGFYLNFGRKRSSRAASSKRNNITETGDPARLNIISQSGPFPRDSWHLYVYRVKLTKPISRISIRAQGDNVIAMDVSRPIVGLRSSTSKGEVSRAALPGGLGLAEQFSNASGEYEIIVVCSTEDAPSLACDLTP